MASLFLSAAHKSSGKTTLSIGLCAALRNRGLKVQPFKKGPDYIDPIWLGMAAGKPCYNLDFFVAGKQETIDDYYHRGRDADICLIEGNKGLYDGLDLFQISIEQVGEQEIQTSAPAQGAVEQLGRQGAVFRGEATSRQSGRKSQVGEGEGLVHQREVEG